MAQYSPPKAWFYLKKRQSMGMGALGTGRTRSDETLRGGANAPGTGGTDILELMIALSQSNGSGRLTNNQAYVPSRAGGEMLGNDDVVKDIADPTDSATAQVDSVSADGAAAGSVWPLVASRLQEANPLQRIVVKQMAKGGSTVTDWAPGGNRLNPSTLFGSANRRSRLGTSGRTRLICSWIGETNAGLGTTGAAFKAGYNAAATAFGEEIPGVKILLAKFQNCTDAEAAAGQAVIKTAIGELWNTGNILPGPDLTPIPTDSDGLHLNKDIKGSIAADKWVTAIQAATGQVVGLVPTTNYLPKPETFNAWTAARCSVTINQVANPVNGATTADLITTDAVVGTKTLTSLIFSVTAGQKRCTSFYAYAGTAQYVQVLGTSAAFGTFFANFDLVNGVIGSFSACEHYIEPVAGYPGWYRCQVLHTVEADSAVAQIVFNCIPASTASRGATGADNVTYYLYGAANELRLSAGPYVPQVNNDAGLDTDAILLIDRMLIDPSAARRALINSTVVALKAASLWTAGLIYFPAAHDSQAGLLCWNNSTYNATTAGTVTFATDGGYKGDGSTGYLNLNVAWNAIPNGFGQDAGTIAVRETLNLNDDTFSLGALSSANLLLRSRGSANTAAGRVNSTSNSAPANTDSRKLVAATRTSSVNTDTYIDGALAASSSAGSVVPTATGIVALRSVSTYSPRQVGFIFVGGAITAQQHADLRTIVEAWVAGL